MMVRSIRWVFHENPIRLWSVVFVSAFLSLTSTLLIELFLARGPSVAIRQESGEVAVVENMRVAIAVDQKRFRASCEGSYTKRRMRHYPAGVTPRYGAHWDGAVDLLDTQNADDDKGDFTFTLYAKLPFPLPVYPSGKWYLDGRIHDNCGLFGSVLSLFAPAAIPLPPVPVEVVGK